MAKEYEEDLRLRSEYEQDVYLWLQRKPDINNYATKLDEFLKDLDSWIEDGKNSLLRRINDTTINNT